MRWTAVVNPGAGRRHGARELARLGDALAARAIAVHATRSADEGLEVARAAFARGDGVLACGGDGTVQVLAQCAAESDGLLGVIPVGSGNDFARGIGLDPTDPLAALHVLDAGHETRLDLGRVRTADGATMLYTTVAHSGLDGEVNRWANTVTRLSGTALYAVAAVRTIATYHPTEMRMVIDGVEWTGRPWLVAVANTHCYGGGMDIAPAARVDDGLLDVIVVHGVSRARVLRCFPRMIKGTHLTIEGVEHFRGTVVEIDGPDDQEIYASGERVGLLPATIDVRPAALRVMVP
ncbi:MAG: diacylglycerol kinase family lipid kinase [Actinobacteria bacterium]|nr:diacylglycerol kinase family lipid kinase [Actinomycetota bacterium]